MVKLIQVLALSVLLMSCISEPNCATNSCGGETLGHEQNHPPQSGSGSGTGESGQSEFGQNPRDLERIAAMNEQQVLHQRAQRFAEQFGLSMERSEELSRIYSVWSKKTARRELTLVEQDMFSLQTLGTDFTTLKLAIKHAQTGDKGLLEQIATQAAQLNSTTPEQMQQILNQLYFR